MMMSKLERLLKLAEMSREHRTGTVREMSRLCGVSQRTIFRDLKTLATLNLPDDLRLGARRSMGEHLARVLDADERSLLSFVLDHNPLVEIDHLAPRLEQIRAKLGIAGSSRLHPPEAKRVDFP
jgi:predicted DNA-binding transcriptional regulator AlpA